MIRYFLIAEAIKNKENFKLVEEIDKEFFTCFHFPDHEERLQLALDNLSKAGEPEIANNISKYLFGDA